jgi:SAM-dependent methyltransferase
MAHARPQDRLAQLRDFRSANGPRWLTYFLLERLAARAQDYAFRERADLELERRLPGENTVLNMQRAWGSWDWSDLGEEWTLSPEWRQSVIDELLLANAPNRPVSIEIGPGAGRWTDILQSISERLILLDITERTLELCRQRFAACNNIDYRLTDGASLDGVADNSVDFIWSFDAFVHIAPADQEGYVREFARVMKPEARAVIHHSGEGGRHERWRSSMTVEGFAALLEENGLQLVNQLTSWGPENEFTTPMLGDAVSIFKR